MAIALTSATWHGSAASFVDAEIAGLICPRPLHIEVGRQDELLAIEVAHPSGAHHQSVAGSVAMDWVTLTRQQVDGDALPSVCMVCGSAASVRLSKTFTYHPDWVSYLYLAGVVPGLIAESLCSTEMRVSCPLCAEHQNHWLKLTLTASMGWLVSLPLSGIGFLAGRALADGSTVAPFVGFGLGATMGLISWLGLVIHLATTRVKVTEIAADTITLQRVADAFARATSQQDEMME